MIKCDLWYNITRGWRAAWLRLVDQRSSSRVATGLFTRGICSTPPRPARILILPPTRIATLCTNSCLSWGTSPPSSWKGRRGWNVSRIRERTVALVGVRFVWQEPSRASQVTAVLNQRISRWDKLCPPPPPPAPPPDHIYLQPEDVDDYEDWPDDVSSYQAWGYCDKKCHIPIDSLQAKTLQEVEMREQVSCGYSISVLGRALHLHWQAVPEEN